MKSRQTKSAKTMEDIARLARVSKPTVSRALHDSPLVAPETKRRVFDVARRYGYVVNRNAQKLRERRTNTVAVVIDFPSLPDHRISDPFHFELLANVANALAVRNQDVLLCSPRLSETGGYELLISSRGADGIIFLGQGGRQPQLLDLARTQTPFVVWGAALNGAGYCTVGSDNFKGGQLVGQYFMERNRRSIAFLGPEGHPEIDLRRAGLGAALSRHAPPLDVFAKDLSYRANFEAMLRHLETSKTPPDAVFAASDTIAMAAIGALHDRGAQVPDTTLVVGYDDSPYAPLHRPPLTTIHQNPALAGTVLVEKLMQILDGVRAKPALLPTELIVRGT